MRIIVKRRGSGSVTVSNGRRLIDREQVDYDVQVPVGALFLMKRSMFPHDGKTLHVSARSRVTPMGETAPDLSIGWWDTRRMGILNETPWVPVIIDAVWEFVGMEDGHKCELPFRNGSLNLLGSRSVWEKMREHPSGECDWIDPSFVSVKPETLFRWSTPIPGFQGFATKHEFTQLGWYRTDERPSNCIRILENSS